MCPYLSQIDRVHLNDRTIATITNHHHCRLAATMTSYFFIFIIFLFSVLFFTFSAVYRPFFPPYLTCRFAIIIAVQRGPTIWSTVLFFFFNLFFFLIFWIQIKSKSITRMFGAATINLKPLVDAAVMNYIIIIITLYVTLFFFLNIYHS